MSFLASAYFQFQQNLSPFSQPNRSTLFPFSFPIRISLYSLSLKSFFFPFSRADRPCSLLHSLITLFTDTMEANGFEAPPIPPSKICFTLASTRIFLFSLLQPRNLRLTLLQTLSLPPPLLLLQPPPLLPKVTPRRTKRHIIPSIHLIAPSKLRNPLY